MDENFENTEVMESNADQQDAFLDGWGNEDGPDAEATADGQDVGDQERNDESETDAGSNSDESDVSDSADAGTAEAAQEPESAENAEQQPPEGQQETPKTWTLRHLDSERTVGESEMIALAQKGLDYDRIRGKYDEAKPVIEMFGEFAREAGMSIPDYIRNVRTEAKRAGGMSEEEARRAVDLEEREASIHAEEARQQERESARNAQQQRISRELAEFERAFPDAYNHAKSDPKTIPQSVWAEVNNGLSLTAAYSRYAVEQARASVKTAQETVKAVQQMQKNAHRSTGSMKSAGNDNRNVDAFLAGFGS